MKLKKEILDIINMANGTEMYHRLFIDENLPVVTDGIMALAESADCFWLIDTIASNQIHKNLDEHFQVWKLTVNNDNSAVLKGYNDVDLIITQNIEFTDFPLEEIKIYLIDGVMLLPSEY